MVAIVRRNVTIDRIVRDNVRAHLRVLVKRILRKYVYPQINKSARYRSCWNRPRFRRRSRRRQLDPVFCSQSARYSLASVHRPQKGTYQLGCVITLLPEIYTRGLGHNLIDWQFARKYMFDFGWQVVINRSQLLTHACATRNLATYRFQAGHQAPMPIRELFANCSRGSERAQLVAQAYQPRSMFSPACHSSRNRFL